MTFLSLPNEIILEVSSKLPLSDQYSLLRTNRRLSYLLQDDLIKTVLNSSCSSLGCKVLFAYASRNDTQSVHFLLDHGLRSSVGSSPDLFFKAIQTQTKITLQTLLDCGIDPNINDKMGVSPLLFAIICRRMEMVRVLLSNIEYNVNVNTPYLEGFQTPLILAIQLELSEAVIMLLAHPHIQINDAGCAGSSALRRALDKKNIHILSLLLADSRLDISTTNGNTITPLIYAIRKSFIEGVQLLLRNPRLEINFPTPNQHTPLHEAAKLQDASILKILLQDIRLNVNARNSSQDTPLHIASYESEAAVKILLEDGIADINARNERNKTPLHRAVESGSEEIIRMLLQDSRIDVSVLDHLQETPLHIATSRRGGNIAKIMLEDQRRRRALAD
ncbi:ankyrin repeat-containing domain protein [Tuber indicum]|nr:ankyrin repeat-containing domain protein [Tuber indicum]